MSNFACNPVAWTGSTNGIVKSEVVLLDVKTEDDLEKYKGKLSGKIILMPSTATNDVSFEPLASQPILTNSSKIYQWLLHGSRGRRHAI